MEAKKDVIPFSSSPLTALLQGALGLDSRVMVIFTLGPTSLTADVTASALDFSGKIRKISRPDGGDKDKESSGIKKADVRIRSLSAELKGLKSRLIEAESSLNHTRTVAEEIVRKSSDRNATVVQHYKDEKEINKQLHIDLELTYKNLKRAISELHEQRKVNEELLEIVRGSEKDK
jgi:vacuolar-type H+-ATPase subunit I/STV1